MLGGAAARSFPHLASADDTLQPLGHTRLMRDPPARDWMVEGCFLKGTVALIAGDGGIGKCVGAGTPILMYDGSIMPAEQVKNGDVLMGPDSKPRLVRGVTAGSGPLFRVTPVKGDPYVVNSNHVLSLKLWAKSAQRQFDFPVNLSVRQYLALPKEKKRALMGWRSGVEWPERAVEMQPYLLGLWLGDGTAGFPDITSADGAETVIPAMEEFAEGTELSIRSIKREDQGLATTYRLRRPGGQKTNPFVETLRSYGIYNEKSIPADYLANSKRVRLELLAGLIDTDGHLLNGCYEIVQKRRVLAEQIAFLARSLGLAAYVKITMKRSQVSELRPYHRVHISGEISRVPVRLAHKKAAARRQKKNVLVTSIKVEPIGEGAYFGFEVDADHLFLLGDFTVTHNSLLCQQLATSAVLGRPWLGISLKPGRALYLACEDDGDELHRRQCAVNRDLGYEMADVLDAGLELIPRVGQDNAIMAFDRPTWRMKRTSLMDKLVFRCREEGVQYVVIDTATQTFRGNQNDETQVADYITELRRLAIAIQGVVVLTKHPSMAGRALGTGESGNVAWHNSVRSRLYLHEHKTLGLVLSGMKANYSRKLDPVPLVWERGVFRRVETQARDYSEPGGYA